HTRFSRDWSSDVCSSDLSWPDRADRHGRRHRRDPAVDHHVRPSRPDVQPAAARAARSARRRRQPGRRHPHRHAPAQPHRAPGVGPRPRSRTARVVGPVGLAGAGVPGRGRRTRTPHAADRGGTGMTTLTATRRRPKRPQRPRRAKGGARRVAALARAELRLLVRNRTAMFTALALPIAMVGLLRMSGTGDDAAAGVGATMTAMMIGFVLLFVVYYNLVSAYVGRREELVLKRLRVGEASDAEILTGTALPSLILALVQTVLMTLGVAMT